MVPPKKNKRGGGKYVGRKRAQEKNDGGDNGPNANGSYWAAQLAKPSPNARKTFESEFPALPGTAGGLTSNKDNWVSPADMRDPNEWDTSGACMDGWNNGTADDLLACGLYNKTVAQYKEELAAQRPQDTLIDTNPVDPNAWVDTTPVKTAEELLKERVEKNCKGWPWIGCPEKLITLVRDIEQMPK